MKKNQQEDKFVFWFSAGLTVVMDNMHCGFSEN